MDESKYVPEVEKVLSDDLDRAAIKKQAIKLLEERNYKFLSDIGEGTFGDVVAVIAPDGNTKLAVKIVGSHHTFKGELEMWPELQHENILPLFDTIRESDFTLFVMPLHMKSLKAILKEQDFKQKNDSFELTKKWLLDILEGLKYIHEKDICHLDLKADNVLITSRMSAVICDFSCMNLTFERIKHFGLPWRFQPPETCQSSVFLLGVDGAAFDLWSFGILALCIWTDNWSAGKIKSLNWKRDVYPLLFQVLQTSVFEDLLDQALPGAKVSSATKALALNFIQGVLRYEPSDRLMARLIRHHTVFNEQGPNFEPDRMWIEKLEWKEFPQIAPDLIGLADVIDLSNAASDCQPECEKIEPPTHTKEASSKDGDKRYRGGSGPFFSLGSKTATKIAETPRKSSSDSILVVRQIERVPEKSQWKIEEFQMISLKPMSRNHGVENLNTASDPPVPTQNDESVSDVMEVDGHEDVKTGGNVCVSLPALNGNIDLRIIETLQKSSSDSKLLQKRRETHLEMNQTEIHDVIPLRSVDAIEKSDAIYGSSETSFHDGSTDTSSEENSDDIEDHDVSSTSSVQDAGEREGKLKRNICKRIRRWILKKWRSIPCGCWKKN